MSDDWSRRAAFAVSFLRNVAGLGVTVGAVVYFGLAYALDGRYAPAAMVNQVEQNTQAAQEIGAKLQDLSATLADTKSFLLRREIFDLKLRQCSADTPQSRQYYAREVQDSMSAYYQLTGERLPSQPDCQDLQ